MLFILGEVEKYVTKLMINGHPLILFEWVNQVPQQLL